MIILLYSILIFYIIFKYCNAKDIFNPAIFFLLGHFIFLFIALTWAKNYEMMKEVYISDVTTFYVIYSMSITTLIIAINNKIRDKRNKTYSVFYEWNLVKPNHQQTAWILFFLGVFFWIFFVFKAGQIPIFSSDIENFRIEAREGMGYVTILSITFITYSGLYLAISLNNKVRIFIILCISSFILLSFGNRAPMLYFLLFYFIFLCIKYKIKINLVKVLPIALAGYLLLVLLGAYRMNVDANLSDKFLLTLGWRPYVNLQNLDLILNYFTDFLYGKGYWIDLYVLAPGPDPNLGTWIKDVLRLEFDGGSVTITYLGDAFVNFGFLGVIVYPIIFPLLYIKLNNIFRRIYLKNNKIHLGHAILFLTISLNLGGAVSSGILSPILYGICPMYIIYKLHTILSRKKTV